MAYVRSRANPLLSTIPHFLTWRNLGFRSICCGRLGFSTQSQLDLDQPLAGTKVLDTYKEEFEIGSRLITLETGKVARFANGAVVLGVEETKVLSTVASAKGDAVRDFLPLTVDYQEKQFAQGVIPNTFMRREGAPKERELLCGRLIDRPIRPLFPTGFYHEVQVMASVLSSDGKQDPDVLAANATSAALMLSDIPWDGPIGVIRIGRICGQFVVNPTMDELSLSDLNLVYACTRDKTLMIDVQAREISEKDLEAGLRLAHPEAVKYIEPQIRLAAKAGKSKKEYKLSMLSDRTLEKVSNLAGAPIEAVFTDPTYGKFERGEALDNISQDVKKALEEECDEESLKVLSKAVDTVRKNVVRKRILADGFRVDGRRLDEVRPLYCEAGNLPILHGSALFSRGDTQVLCTVTLGAPEDAQRLESLVGPPTKRFMLHYSFPPFSINEVGKRVGLNRREVGHGTLAEKALLAVLPPEDDFPYTVRVNSEVMASDGSTSMATVCGGSMALMDAGIPVREHVAGVSVGLVSEIDPSTGDIWNYRILTDILGLEDHLGDMDFKISGTQNGVTAIQLDIKPAGIPLDIICECLEPARKARLQILDHMKHEINTPRNQDKNNAPRLVTLKYSNEDIRRLIGPLGVLKRKIEEKTGARISVGDGTLTIIAKNQSAMDKVLEEIEYVVGREIEVGGVYKGVVTSIKEYGAFVEFNGGQQGLLHISELSHEPVSRVSEVVSVGQQLSVVCIGQDVRGNIKLSLKATLPRPRGLDGNDSVEGSVPSAKKTPNRWAPAGNMSIIQEQQSSVSELPGDKHEVGEAKPPASKIPSILIRSPEECDEEEKATSLNHPSKKARKSVNGSQLDRKLKHRQSQDDENDSLFSILDSFPYTNVKKSKSLSQKEESNSVHATGGDEEEAGDREPVTSQNLKLGTKVTATVYQVRARGLVLDLGGGLRGMHRFETESQRDLEVGDKIRVVCSSFSSKGIPYHRHGFMVTAVVPLTILVLLSTVCGNHADPRDGVVARTCGHTPARDMAKYKLIYEELVHAMKGEMGRNKFSINEFGEPPDRVYVFAQCMNDISSSQCIRCFDTVKDLLPGCFPSTGGRVYSDYCFIRAENYSFLQESVGPDDLKRCGDSTVGVPMFSSLAIYLINQMALKAPEKGGFIALQVEVPSGLEVYGLATCWQTLDHDMCSACLANAASTAISCLPSADARVLNAGCFLHYADYDFTAESRARKAADTFLMYLAYVLAAIAVCLLAIFVGYYAGKRTYDLSSSARKRQGSEVDLQALRKRLQFMQFKYSTLEKATEGFNESHKLGQGGYGEVYKGTLPDGREIAIKHLFNRGNGQADDVINEMDVISRAQHKNLVRFLGCCFTSYDSFLIYEFLVNRSLNIILFDPEKRKELDWPKRRGIIIGTAEGLEYLHDNSQVRIIHRDIKASNILLDLKHKPKIADFGLARFYSNKKTTVNTTIAGTLGYMAPEYLAEGRLTEKVDVYSFGVLVLEIVCGVENSKFQPAETFETLVTHAWKHFQLNTATEIIDKSMEGEDIEEITRAVQVGLLCTQELPSLRPNMTEVTKMLKQKDTELPAPSKPPYIGYSLELSSSTGFSSNSSRPLNDFV
ncbi:hypothetical protein L6164_005098 [Bauhinia variegata]|uniref:Uncharacterized protein n=1 Tax=Bauhinia variegata TaxID=167791 RepID=A0ACB9PPJ4_BAUVA|nr:hypothetical protein L6164_005098 [Bauhinia variegata]